MVSYKTFRKFPFFSRYFWKLVWWTIKSDWNEIKSEISSDSKPTWLERSKKTREGRIFAVIGVSSAILMFCMLVYVMVFISNSFFQSFFQVLYLIWIVSFWKWKSSLEKKYSN